jgi:hypothetical protein
MIKNLLVSLIAILFAFAASAAEVTTKDGSMVFEIAEDSTVTMKDGTPAKDGDYMLSDGTTLVVKEGKQQ